MEGKTLAILLGLIIMVAAAAVCGLFLEDF